MTGLALLALLAGPSLHQLLDRSMEVPAGSHHPFPIPHMNRTLRVDAEWHADTDVTVLVMEEKEYRKRLRGQAHAPLAMGDYEQDGELHVWLPAGGNYVLVLDNRMNPSRPAKVRLKLTRLSGGDPIHPDRKKARTLVLGSAALFLVICVVAGARLKQAIENRREVG